MDQQVPWVPEGEFKADPLGDLPTTKGALSMWRLDEGRSEYHIAAAVAALQRPGNLDYFLIDEDALYSRGFMLEQCPGNSADPNLSKKCHLDIVRLTEKRLLELAALFREEGETRICTQPLIIQTLADGLEQGRIDRAQIKEWWITEMRTAGLLLD